MYVFLLTIDSILVLSSSSSNQTELKREGKKNPLSMQMFEIVWINPSIHTRLTGFFLFIYFEHWEIDLSQSDQNQEITIQLFHFIEIFFVWFRICLFELRYKNTNRWFCDSDMCTFVNALNGASTDNQVIQFIWPSTLSFGIENGLFLNGNNLCESFCWGSFFPAPRISNCLTLTLVCVCECEAFFPFSNYTYTWKNEEKNTHSQRLQI